MKSQTITSVIVILAVLVLLGYGLLRTSASAAEVQTKVDELTSLKEKKALDVNIMSNATITDVETLRIFGSRPVAASADRLNRTNPFDGL